MGAALRTALPSPPSAGGTAEEAPFTRDELGGMLEMGEAAIRRILEAQRAALGIA